MSEPIPGWHQDGITARRHAVFAAIEDGMLWLADAEKAPLGEPFPVAELVPLGDHTRAAFGRIRHDGWRLAFDQPLPPDWIAALPRQEKHGAAIDRFGLVPALIVAALIAVVVILALGEGTRLLAHAVPERWEIALGDAVAGNMGDDACTLPAGQTALEALTTRLSSDGKPVTVRVVNVPMSNAVALPGRQVIIFRGLLDEAVSADEVAGVLAHELGHVENRDAMASLIRGYGISLLLGGADGGAIAQTLIASRYSRETEASADEHAIEALNRNAISPNAIAGFFDRLGKGEEALGKAARILSYVESHPLSTDRRERFRESVRKDVAYRRALTGAEWAALKGICGGKK